MRRRRVRLGSQSGFTMLELVLVMVIICTTLAMAAPSLRGFFASRRTQDAAAGIVALTKYARSQAAAEGRTYRLNLDADGGRYWLTAQRGGAFVRLDTEPGRVFLLPRGTEANWETPDGTEATGHANFYPDGRADAVGITLTGQQGDKAKIECKAPALGFNVVDPNAEDEE